MVKNSPDTCLTEKKSATQQIDVRAQEFSSCPNFAQKMCLQIEYTPAQEDHFKTPITKAIKKDKSAKTAQKQRCSPFLSALTKKEQTLGAMSMNTPNQEDQKLEDVEMQDTQASTQYEAVSPFQSNQSQAQFKIAVNLVPNATSVTNLDMTCDSVLTESRNFNTQTLTEVNLTESQEMNEKYYKKFDFFYRRTAFRSMTEFYKGLFKPDLDKWREGERKSTKNFLHQYLWKKSQNDSKKYEKLQVLVKSNQFSQKLVNQIPNQSQKISDKIKDSLEKFFLPLENESAQLPVSDSDLKNIKHNLRKQALFEQAYYFCEDLFTISEKINESDANEELESPMNTTQILQFTSAVLSIVLSHHFQKEDIKKMVQGTSVDFQMVRDTMYKYSKKAEERFFTDPCFAYFFIQFAKSEQGKSYIENKLGNSGQNMDQEINQPHNQNRAKSKVGQISKKIEGEDAAERQKEMNERIASEIDVMSQEAQEFLVKSFEQDIAQLYSRCKSNQSEFNFENASQTEQIEYLIKLSRDTFIGHVMLQNIGVDCDNIVSQRVIAMTQTQVVSPKKSKPIIDSILEDISLEKMKKQKQEQAFCLNQKQFPAKTFKDSAENNKKLVEFLTPKKPVAEPLVLKKFGSISELNKVRGNSALKSNVGQPCVSKISQGVDLDQQAKLKQLLEHLPLLKQISQKKNEQISAQKATSPSENTFKNLNRNASSGSFFKCQSEHQTPLKTFKSFQHEKVDGLFKQPAFVLPTLQSQIDNSSSESDFDKKSNEVVKRSESKHKVFSPVLIDQKSNGITGKQNNQSLTKINSCDKIQATATSLANNTELLQKLLSITQNLLNNQEQAKRDHQDSRTVSLDDANMCQE